MIVELHIVQNLAPSNINRDDLGSPKEAIFGGYRRARVSSQSWKKAIRDSLKNDPAIEDYIAKRSKRMMEQIKDGLTEVGRSEDEALRVAEVLFLSISVERDYASKSDVPETTYLLYLSDSDLTRLIEVANKHWDELYKLGMPLDKKLKKDLSKKISRPVKTATSNALDGSIAVDLALFGRMLADLPIRNVEAAVQVAHAISTHEVTFEQDFYTAVDHLNPRDRTGAAMMGYVGFDSATLYRYSNLDTTQLLTNLGNDNDLALQAIRSYVRAFVTSMPTGKQHSMPTPTLPTLALAVVRDTSRWSLANAFANPVPVGQGDIMSQSVEALGAQWRALVNMYEGDDVRATPILIDERYTQVLGSGFGKPSRSIAAWIDDVASSIQLDSTH